MWKEKKKSIIVTATPQLAAQTCRAAFIKVKAWRHQAHDDVQHRSTTSPAALLQIFTHRLHGLEWCCVHIDAAAVRSFGDGLEHLRLSGGGERRGGGRLLRGQRHGGLWQRREIFTVSVMKSNAPGSSELFWSSAAHLDGVDVFCWGSRVRRVSALIHGGRSRGNDRNLRTQRSDSIGERF